MLIVSEKLTNIFCKDVDIYIHVCIIFVIVWFQILSRNLPLVDSRVLCLNVIIFICECW